MMHGEVAQYKAASEQREGHEMSDMYFLGLLNCFVFPAPHIWVWSAPEPSQELVLLCQTRISFGLVGPSLLLFPIFWRNRDNDQKDLVYINGMRRCCGLIESTVAILNEKHKENIFQVLHLKQNSMRTFQKRCLSKSFKKYQPHKT